MSLAAPVNTGQNFAALLRGIRMSMRTRLSRRPRTASQAEFAHRFGLTVAAVRDAEQGRYVPGRAMRVVICAMKLDPDLVERAAALAMSIDDPSAGDL